MNGFRKGSYLANPTGFRASPLSLNPILAGRQNTNFNALALPDYVSYADLQAQKAAAAAAAAALLAMSYNNDNGGDGSNPSGGNYAVGYTGLFSPDVAPSGWGDSEGASNNAADDDMGDADIGGFSGGYGDDAGDDGGNDGADADGNDGEGEGGGWYTGGTIPPMYAVEGSYIDNVLGLPDNRTAFDTTTGLLKDNIKDIGGTITTTAQDLFNTSSDFVNKQTTPTAIKDTVFNALVTAALKANPTTAPLANLKTAYDMIQAVNNYSKNQADQTEALDPSVEMESLEALPSELGTGITNPADFSFKDNNYGYNMNNITANTNYGAIPGNYSSPTSSISKNSIDSWQDLNSYISNIEPVNPGLQTDFDSQLEAAISAELGDYTNSMETSTPSTSPSMSDHAAVHGSANDASGGSVSGPDGSGGYGGSSGGYGDDGPGGGYGDGDSDSGSGQDGAGGGDGNGADGDGNDGEGEGGGWYTGGKIPAYAYQGKRIQQNSVGGK